MENNNKRSMMNLVAKTITALPEEVCNIIYEYYKLPFIDELPKTNKWHRVEKELGRELSELMINFMIVELVFKQMVDIIKMVMFLNNGQV